MSTIELRDHLISLGAERAAASLQKISSARVGP